MPQTLLIVPETLDALWYRRLGEESLGGDVPPSCRPMVLVRQRSPEQPAGHDVVGWRRWFKKRRGVVVHLFLNDTLGLGVLAAAALARVDLTVHLTGRLRPELLRYATWCARRVRCFACPALFVERQLLRAGISGDRITVTAAAGAASRRVEAPGLADRSEPSRLLAVARPAEPEALKPVVWAVALLKHVMPDVTLTVAGRCAGRDRGRLESWQKTMDARDLLDLAEGRSWDELAGEADIIVSGHPVLSDVVRLWHARETGRPVIALAGDASEVLQGCPNATMVQGPAPRHLAAAALRLLKEPVPRAS